MRQSICRGVRVGHDFFAFLDEADLASGGHGGGVAEKSLIHKVPRPPSEIASISSAAVAVALTTVATVLTSSTCALHHPLSAPRSPTHHDAGTSRLFTGP